MMWDASQAYGTCFRPSHEFQACSLAFPANNRYDAAIKNVLLNGGGSVTTVPSTSNPPSTTPPSSSSSSTSKPSTPTTGPGNCSGVNSWVSNVAVSLSSVRWSILSLTWRVTVQWR